jgi:zinc/manganese transport system substrate-binding protein
MDRLIAIDLQYSKGNYAAMLRIILGLALLFPLAVTGRSASVQAASLNTVMADLARSIGGERIDVLEVVHAGMDPHLYEPSPGDWKRIEQADVLLAGGLGFEPYLGRMKTSLVNAGVRVVVGGDVVTPIEGACAGHAEEGHHHHGEMDPHWWHSVGNTRAVVSHVSDALIAEDPAGRAVYEANAVALDQRLEALEKWIRLEVAKVPKARRVLVTSHDALGYLAVENGFDILPVQGLSKSSQPSSRQVTELIREIREKNVKAIFAERLENPKVLEQITAETGARPAGVLHADGLGKGPASTYEGMMKHNISTIVEALK